MDIQAGLEWVRPTRWGSEPRWTGEPNTDAIASIACRHLGLFSTEGGTIELIGQGAFNKVFKVTCPKGTFAVRVTLPVDPRYKTLSEVATLDLVREHTSIPVPKVIAFDAFHDNCIGFEWILMEYVSGTHLQEAWSNMSWSAKYKLVDKLVNIASELFRIRCNAIGNVYRSGDRSVIMSPNTESGLPSGYVLGRIVSMPFFWEKHISLEFPRGPFRSSKEWLTACLAHKQYDCEQAMQNVQADSDNSSDDSDDEDENQMTANLIERLLEVLPKFFPSTDDEVFALHHDDIHSHNIMVNAFGELEALIDWECVSVLPLWKVCQFPSLLEGKMRTEEPDMEQYSRNDDGTLDEMYAKHRLEYEKTLLRGLFIQRMETVEPRWIAEFRTLEGKADFAYAVQNCDTPFCRRRIGR